MMMNVRARRGDAWGHCRTSRSHRLQCLQKRNPVGGGIKVISRRKQEERHGGDESEGEWSAAFLLENRKVGPFSRLGDGRALTPYVSPNIDDRLAAVLSKYGGIGRRKRKKTAVVACCGVSFLFVIFVPLSISITLVFNFIFIFFLPPPSTINSPRRKG